MFPAPAPELYPFIVADTGPIRAAEEALGCCSCDTRGYNLRLLRKPVLFSVFLPEIEHLST
jgi:hypothetical protein